MEPRRILLLCCVCDNFVFVQLRLCCTSWLNGYIPVDSTGDGIYQVRVGKAGSFVKGVVARCSDASEH